MATTATNLGDTPCPYATGHHPYLTAGTECTGMGFGFTATLVAAIASAHAAHGFSGVATAWQTYLLIALGPLFFLPLQKALRAGRLVAAQPALTLSNPIVAFGFGIAVFGEHVRGGGWLALAALGAALIGVATVALARSPLLQGSRGHSEGSPPGAVVHPARPTPAGALAPQMSRPLADGIEDKTWAHHRLL